MRYFVHYTQRRQARVVCAFTGEPMPAAAGDGIRQRVGVAWRRDDSGRLVPAFIVDHREWGAAEFLASPRAVEALTPAAVLEALQVESDRWERRLALPFLPLFGRYLVPMDGEKD